MLPFIHKLFNRFFFLQAWSESIIVLVFKKGDVSDPHKPYQWFLQIIYINLKSTSSFVDNGIITDAQFVFQPNRGTAEAIFRFSTIIDTT